jgi:hypothetical protein
MPLDERHLCHAKGCSTPCPPNKLMCGRHWRMVPKNIQYAVYRQYRPGQEVTKTPSDAYLRVAQMAIDAVAQREGL